MAAMVEIPRIDADEIVIIGAGIAGLFAALQAAPRRVCVVGLSRAHSASHWAQGGIAAALDAHDSWQAHCADTIAAGVGLTRPDIAELITKNAPARITELEALGVAFDRKPTGAYLLRREGGHGAARILSIEGDRSGAQIMAALYAAADQAPHIRFLEGVGVHSLLTDAQNHMQGLLAHPAGAMERTILLRSPHIVLATGGAGHLYAVTTNPRFACGQAFGMAARAGAIITDVEFMQFHPTALHEASDPAPLATEALRGEGAQLVNSKGEAFMASYHPQADLAPRDVVTRAVATEMAEGTVGLRLPKNLAKQLGRSFPTMAQSCAQLGLDPLHDAIPVTPAAHYHMGGVQVDAHGRSSLKGLWVCGEAAASGVHGANRLASNSLLEALIFAARIAQDLKATPVPKPTRQSLSIPKPQSAKSPKSPPKWLRLMMSEKLGVRRQAQGIAQMLAALMRWEDSTQLSPVEKNIHTAALLISAAALQRQESRGAHWRSDYPTTQAQARRLPLDLAQARALAQRTQPQSQPA